MRAPARLSACARARVADPRAITLKILAARPRRRFAPPLPLRPRSFVHQAKVDASDVPPGALVSFIQKGLQYLELEANLADDGQDVEGDFAHLTSDDLLTKDVDELKEVIRDRKAAGKVGPSAAAKAKMGSKDKGGKGAVKAEEPEPMDTEEGANGGGATADADGAGENLSLVAAADVLTLEGHGNEVFTCAWSPSGEQLASGSGDSTARIWGVGSGGGQTEQVVLKHFQNNKAGDRDKDVTTLDWNKEGTLLATGSYDGVTRLWTSAGELKATHAQHKGAVFTLKFNGSGNLLLSGSVDKTSVVWDVSSGAIKQQYRLHEAPVLDVAWRDDTTFATCSTDSNIYVCEVDKDEPVCSFKGSPKDGNDSGHSNDVNAVRWDPTGRVLASCSDDCTVRIWSVEKGECLHVMREHKKEIYTVEFAPAGTGPGATSLLASASFDSTVRVWDVDAGKCLYTLSNHKDPVYTVAFSPDGKYLASGSFDQWVHVWSVADGSLVKSYKGTGGIFELAWNPKGERLAACFSNNRVSVLDLKL